MPEQADWLRAMAMMGQYAGSQVQMLVGSDGSLYAVLQGDYDGVLKTVKLDSAGRISAFVIDSSDAWGQLLAVGNAELAARLGSLIEYDRRGQVVSQTSFENGWGVWRTAVLGSGTTVALDPTVARHGGYSVKCTGGGISTSDVKLFTRMPVLPVATVGLSAFFSIPGEARYLELVIQYDDAANRPQGRCRYDVAAETLSIVNSSGAWIEVATSITINKNKHSFNYMKLVIDGDNDTYFRLVFNDLEIDLSSYATQILVTVDYSHFYLGIWAFNREDQADITYLDCAVVTVNEPT